jgi:hypothetical protein
MKSYQSIGVLLLVVFAFSAVLAASASADEVSPAAWLANGEAITSSLAADTTGELIIEDAKAGAGVTCSMSIDGTVGASGEGEITAILSLSGTEVTLSAPLLCKSHKSCEEGTDVEVSPEKLPWTTVVGVSGSGTYLEIVSEPTFYATCLVLGIKISDECVGTDSSFEVLNVTGGVEPMGQFLPKANCTIGGTETGSLEFVSGSLATLSGGGTLSASGEFVKPMYEGEGVEKEILEGEWKEEEKGTGQYFTFNNGTIVTSVICQLSFRWAKQARSSEFVITPTYASCTYSGNGEKATVAFGACRYKFKVPMLIPRGWRATVDLIATGCEVKIMFETNACEIKIVGGTSNQNLPWVFEENVGNDLKFNAMFTMVYTSANCAAPIVATGGRTSYTGGMIAFGAKI